MSRTPEFRGAVHQNLYLAPGAREVHVVITIDAQGVPSGLVPGAAEVLILDCSRSMGAPAEKISKAKEALTAAIDELRDGVWFALIAGSDQARMLWPAQPHLVLADPWTRAEAKDALRRLVPGGDAAIGAWLRLAGQLLGQRPGAIRHAILLTDGCNEGESPEALRAALRACEGSFSCDCRVVGTDLSVAELRAVFSALHGTVELVEDPAELAQDFRRMVAKSMRKAIGDVSLRLWTPVGACVRFLKQTAPTLVDLTGHRVEVGELTGEYSTGSWGTESRDYHLCIDLEPGEVGDEKLACRVSVVRTAAGGTEQPLVQSFRHTQPDGSIAEFSTARVRALWTDDLAQSTMIDDRVAVVTGRAELAQAIQDGLAAHRAGEPDLAVECLSRARKLAEQMRDDTLLARLEALSDPDTGTFRLNSMSAQQEMGLDIESTRTTPLVRD